MRRNQIPKQKNSSWDFAELKPIGNIFLIMPAVVMTSLFPALGPTQTGLLFRRQKDSRWLIWLGGITSGAMAISVISWHAIGKTRNGAFEMASALHPEIGLGLLLVLWGSIIISTVFCIFLLLLFKKQILYTLLSLDLWKMQCGILLVSGGLVLYICGMIGLLCWLVSIAVGLYTQFSGNPQYVLMSCLMIPTAVQVSSIA